MLTEDKKGKAITFDYRPKTLQENNQKYSTENMIMMPENEKFNIIYVISKVPREETFERCVKLQEDLPVTFTRVEHIQEIFPLLSNPHLKIDFIAIDVEDLYNTQGIDCFDIIRTLYTLINCTVYRPAAFSKPQKRTTQICAVVPDNVSKEVFKDIVSIPEIKKITLRYGGRVDYPMLKMLVQDHIHGVGERVPKLISNLLKDTKPKPVNKSNEIQLTTRQRQIFDIVTTRGASNKHIAKVLDISESTVKLHIGAILKKHGLKNRTQLAVFSKRSVSQTEVYIP